MIISVLMNEDVTTKRFKAPRGMMFEIWDIHFSVLEGGNNSIGVETYLYEDERSFIGLTSSNLIAVMGMEIAGQAEDFSFTKGEKTKFITVATQNATIFTGNVIIHFELIKASRTELLIEWFRKGR